MKLDDLFATSPRCEYGFYRFGSEIHCFLPPNGPLPSLSLSVEVIFYFVLLAIVSSISNLTINKWMCRLFSYPFTLPLKPSVLMAYNAVRQRFITTNGYPPTKEQLQEPNWIGLCDQMHNVNKVVALISAKSDWLLFRWKPQLYLTIVAFFFLNVYAFFKIHWSHFVCTLICEFIVMRYQRMYLNYVFSNECTWPQDFRLFKSALYRLVIYTLVVCLWFMFGWIFVLPMSFIYASPLLLGALFTQLEIALRLCPRGLRSPFQDMLSPPRRPQPPRSFVPDAATYHASQSQFVRRIRANYRHWYASLPDYPSISEYNTFDEPTRPQGEGPRHWSLKYKGFAKVRTELWGMINADLARDLGIELSLLRSCFNGEPTTYACQAARAAGLPRIVSGHELRALLPLTDDLDVRVQDLLDRIHKTQVGRLVRSHTRLYTTAFTKMRLRTPDVSDIMYNISQNWENILQTLEASKRIHVALQQHKLSRKQRPIRISTDLAEAVIRNSVPTASSSQEATSSQEPQPDDEMLARELEEFHAYADQLAQSRSKKDHSHSTVPPKVSFMGSKKTARHIAKDLKRFKEEHDLDAKFRPTHPQGSSTSWFSTITSILQSDNFQYGLHLCALISSIVIIAYKEDSALRVGATLVGANSLMALSQLWSKPGYLPLGIIGYIPRLMSLAANMAGRLLASGPVLLGYVYKFFKSTFNVIVSADPTGVLMNLFNLNRSTPSTPPPSSTTNSFAPVAINTTSPSPAPVSPYDSALVDAATRHLDEFKPQASDVASSSNGEPAAQFWGFLDFFKSIAAAIAELIFGSLDSKMLSTRVRNFVVGCVAVKHAKDLFQNLQHVVITACNWICVKTVGVALFDDSGIVFAKAVSRLSVECPEFMRIVRNPTATPAEIEVALQWSIRLRELYYNNVQRDPEDAGMKELLRIYSLFSSVQSQFIGKLSETGSRVEPVGVLVQGSAGLGKTALLKYLIALLFDLGVTSNVQQYPRLPDSDYEEGHRDQAHYIFDEFMTINDKEARLNHARQLLSLLNVAPRPINYASVENKGVHFDKSEFVWCTTNATHNSWKETLADPNAITRRFAITITPILPEGGIPVAADGNIDWSRYAFDTVALSDPLENGVVRPVRRTLAQILTVLADARMERISHHRRALAQTIENMRAHVDGYAQLRDDIRNRFNALPVAQGRSPSSIHHQLLEMFIGTPPRKVDRVAGTWAQVKEHALLHLGAPVYIPKYYLIDCPVDEKELELAQAYAACTCDPGMSAAIGNVRTTRAATHNQDEYARYGVPNPNPDPEAHSYVSRYCPRISSFVQWIKLALARLNVFSATRSLAQTFLVASASIVFTTCAAVATVAIGMIVILKSLFSTTPAPGTSVNVFINGSRPQSARDKEERIRARKATVIRNRNNAISKPRPATKAQAHDPNFIGLAASAYCYIHFNKLLPGARAVGIKDHFILTNHHVLKGLSSLKEIEISTSTGRYPVKVADIIRVDNAEDDIAILQLPRTVPQFPDITHRFINDQDLITLGSQYVRAVHAERHPIGLEWSMEYTEPNLISYMDEDSESYHPFGLSLPLPGIAGDCGTLVAAFANTLGPRNLLGIHCAGNDTCSQYTLVTQELLNILLAEFTSPQGFKVAFAPSPALQQQHTVIANEPSLHYLLNAPPQARLLGIISPADHIPRNSKLVPSLLFNKFGKPRRAPATLSQYQDIFHRDPLATAYSNMRKLPPVDLPPWFQQCADQVFRFVKSTTVPRRILTKKEAVLGIGSLPPMVLDTSSGYPWTHHPDAVAANDSTKGFFIRVDPDTRDIWIHPDLDAAIDADLADLACGKRPTWYFADKLKDELVSQEKIDRCKTRVFMAASIVCHIVGRMLFGALIAATDESRMRHPGQSSCAVGTQPHDLSVMAMYQQLYGDEFVVHAHDQKGFDYHQQQPQATCVGNSINKWYGESSMESAARTMYIETCYNSLHVSGKFVYQLDENGMPSGVFFTAHFNSWVLEADSLSVLHEHSRKQFGAGLVDRVLAPRQIKKGIFALYYGDDSWIAIPKKLMSITGQDFFAGYEKLGLEATHCVKDWPVDREVPREEITFLKRKVFKNVDGNIVLALEKEHIYDMLNYVYKQYYNSAQLYNSTARNMLIEIALHGFEEFDRLASLMHASFSSAGIDLTISTEFVDYL